MRAWTTATVVPAARSDGLLIERLGDETVIYDTESKQAHCLKPLAAIVFDQCDGQARVGEIGRVAEERLRQPVTEADVADAVAQLEILGLLQTVLVVRDGDHLVSSNGSGVSRREMIRRVGFAGAGAAVGTSLVTSIFPPAALALSGVPAGCTGCTQNQDCLPVPRGAAGHCCQTNSGKTCNQSCCAGSNNSCHITSCNCSIGGADCSSTACATGTCICICSVCNTEVGGSCPTCPAGSSSCCTSSTVICNAPTL